MKLTCTYEIEQCACAAAVVFQATQRAFLELQLFVSVTNHDASQRDLTGSVCEAPQLSPSALQAIMAVRRSSKMELEVKLQHRTRSFSSLDLWSWNGSSHECTVDVCLYLLYFMQLSDQQKEPLLASHTGAEWERQAALEAVEARLRSQQRYSR